jgi:HSP20 family molecular chaperone IbpA
MFYPKLFNDDLFDDFMHFDFPSFRRMPVSDPTQSTKKIYIQGGNTMFYPKLFNDDLFDDFMHFDFPSFRDTDRKLYGKAANGLMKTDVREHEGNYKLDIDLPGFKKDEITLTLDNGYLVVGAAKVVNEDEKDSQGKLLRQERFSGAMQRSFYVGDGIDENDVKAKFEDGVLSLTFPKEKEPEIPEKKTIMIEG